MSVIVFDVETSIINKGHPFTDENILVSYAVKKDGGSTIWRYYREPDFLSWLRDYLSDCHLLVVFAGKFDYHWLRRVGIVLHESVAIYDVSYAEYILSGQQAGLISLNKTLESYGLPTKPDAVAEYWKNGISTEDIPVEILEEYNKYDVEGTYQCYLNQLKLINKKQLKLVHLMGEDLLYLADAESAGIKFDHEKAETVIRTLSKQLEDIQGILGAYLPVLPKSCNFNFDSGDQLSAFLYGGEITYEWSVPEEAVYQSGEKKGQPYIRNRWHSEKVRFQPMFKPVDGTELAKTKDKENISTRFYQTDDPTIKTLQAKTQAQKDIIKKIQERSKITKIIEMIKSIIDRDKQYGWKGYIHGRFNQNVTRTGRLSSSDPNMQNFSVEVDELLISRYAD